MDLIAGKETIRSRCYSAGKEEIKKRHQTATVPDMGLGFGSVVGSKQELGRVRVAGLGHRLRSWAAGI